MKRETFGEMFRFAVVGTISTVLNYVIYWILQHWINVNVAYTIGYVLSFFVNYWLTVSGVPTSSTISCTSGCSIFSCGWV